MAGDTVRGRGKGLDGLLEHVGVVGVRCWVWLRAAVPPRRVHRRRWMGCSHNNSGAVSCAVKSWVLCLHGARTSVDMGSPPCLLRSKD